MPLTPLHLLVFVTTIFLMSLIIIAFDSGAKSLSLPRSKAEMMLLAGVGAAAVLLVTIGMANLFT